MGAEPRRPRRPARWPWRTGRARGILGLWPAGLAAIALLVALGAVGANAPPARGQNPPLRPAPPALFGIAGHAWWLDEHFDTFLGFYRDLGVTGVRIPLDWKRFEPQEASTTSPSSTAFFPALPPPASSSPSTS